MLAEHVLSEVKRVSAMWVSKSDSSEEQDKVTHLEMEPFNASERLQQFCRWTVMQLDAGFPTHLKEEWDRRNNIARREMDLAQPLNSSYRISSLLSQHRRKLCVPA